MHNVSTQLTSVGFLALAIMWYLVIGVYWLYVGNFEHQSALRSPTAPTIQQWKFIKDLKFVCMYVFMQIFIYYLFINALYVVLATKW